MRSGKVTLDDNDLDVHGTKTGRFKMKSDSSKHKDELDVLSESLKRKNIKKACYNIDHLNDAAQQLGFPCTLVEGLTREEEKRIGAPRGLFTEDDWIDVEDKLPEHDQEVITYMADMPESMPRCYKMGITRYTKEIEVNLEGEKVGDRAYFYGGAPDGHQVTHWMPLMEAPIKEVENEKR